MQISTIPLITTRLIWPICDVANVEEPGALMGSIGGLEIFVCGCERINIRRLAGCATTTGSAGHAGATANLKLTFHPDHSAGADQLGFPQFQPREVAAVPL